MPIDNLALYYARLARKRDAALRRFFQPREMKEAARLLRRAAIAKVRFLQFVQRGND